MHEPPAASEPPPDADGNPPTWFARAREMLLDFLFPRRCVGCGRSGSYLCERCLDSLPRLAGDACNRCGRRLRDNLTGLCDACAGELPALTGCFAAVYSDGAARTAIHRLKYNDRARLAEPLAGLLVEWWRANPLPVDLIVPIPLHPRRERERGYNQSALLARWLGPAIGLSVDEASLIRTRDTRPQVGLGSEERRRNVAGAFHCSGTVLAGRSILLLDDVTTTGATLQYAAEELREGGVREVWALTVARAAPGSLRQG